MKIHNTFHTVRGLLGAAMTTVALTALLASTPAFAFSSLDLVPGTPDIESSDISVNYLGANDGGTLSATGLATVLTLAGSSTNIDGGDFNINADINFNAQTVNGTLSILGSIPSFGFNSGTLLTGTLSSTAGSQAFGAGSDDPLEFLFTVTGGDAAALYAGTAGVILSMSGYTGSFAVDFNSALSGALANTFKSDSVGNPTLGFPSLNLTPGTPDFESNAISAGYIGNNDGGALFATGIATTLSLAGTSLNIDAGDFNLNANINFNAQTANGTLNIGGTIPSFGFNSGTLLTGTFSSTAGSQAFGAGADDPLEFLFTVTGGDAAALYGGTGSTAGVILSQSGYTGSFASDFNSAPSEALANTFKPDSDEDGDGVSDTFDQCPGTAPGDAVDSNGCSDAQLNPSMGGSATGVTIKSVDCRNQTTRQSVRIDVNGSTTDWDCEAAGLVVNPGDKVNMKVKATAN